MKKKFLTTCIAVCALAFGLGLASCGKSEAQDDSKLAFELVNGSYTVVGMGEHEEGILTIPSTYKGKPVTAIGSEAFSGVAELGKVTIPDSVTTIEEKAFYSCINLTELSMGNGVTAIAPEAFAYCNLLENATFSSSLETVGASAFIGCVRLKEAVFADTVKTISNNAFEECKNLQTVTFGKSVELIGERAFYNCVGISGIEIPDGAPTQILKEAFFACGNAQYIRLGNDVTSVGDSAFQSCAFVREIVLGDGLVSIGETAFSGCRKVYQITVGSSLQTVGSSAFEKCQLLREIYNRSDLTITLGNQKALGGLGYYAWYVRSIDEPTRISKDEVGLVYYTEYGAEGEIKRKALIAVDLKTHTDIVVPDDVTEIGEYACYNEQLIKSVVIGSGCTRLGFSAFRNSYKIEYVKLGENVTSIANSVFRYNGYITSLVIGKNIKSVGSEAFLKKDGDRYFKNYKTVYFEGTKAEWEPIKDLIDYTKEGEDNGNGHLNKATVLFYSESKPAASNTYWRYVDGKPTMWE